MKHALRRLIRERISQMSEQQKQAEADHICNSLGTSRRIQEAQTIMAFCPMPDEPDIMPMVRQWASEGKNVLLPHIKGCDETMTALPYHSDEVMEDNPLGFRMPVGSNATADNHIDVVIVPGRAFDSSGWRMGRGKGYYDRFLLLHPEAHTIGVCFQCQRVEEVPHEKHDLPVAEVCSGAADK